MTLLHIFLVMIWTSSVLTILGFVFGLRRFSTRYLTLATIVLTATAYTTRHNSFAVFIAALALPPLCMISTEFGIQLGLRRGKPKLTMSADSFEIIDAEFEGDNVNDRSN